MTEKQFAWVPFIQELAEKISTYRNRQPELIEILKGFIEKHQINFGEKEIDKFENEKCIDPFTAMTFTLYAKEPKNKKPILDDLKTLFQINSQAPESTEGFDNTSATFNFKGSKNPRQEMEMLWDIFEEAKIDDVKEETFNKIIKVVNGVRITSITTGLSWINPNKYIRLNKIVSSYLLNRFDVDFTEIQNWQDYQNALDKIKQTEPNLSEVYYLAYQNHFEEKNNVSKVNFVGVIDKLRNELENSNNTKGLFKFNKTKPTHVWIKDNVELIGTVICHYEIIIDNNKICVDVHFEDKNSLLNGKFKEIFDDLPEELEIIPWRKYIDGIRYGKGIEFKDENLIFKLKEQLLFIENSLGDKLREIIKSNQKENQMNDNNKGDYPLNTILYGPPGTGKTYNVINKALEICCWTEYCEKKERELLLEEFEDLKTFKQASIVTFHQSYGYEEFIEGIKPVEKNGKLTYEIVPGVFKKMCNLALGKEYIFDLERNMWVFSPNDISRIRNCKGSIDFTKHKFADSIKKGDYYLIIDTKNTVNSFGTITNPNDKNDNIFVSWESLDTKLSNPINLGLLENMQQKETTYKEIQKELDFILIIDEINRGNISKIFGELITLIEDSKRLGKPEELRVKLPYSNEDFGVPSNLYIIGTMNTADRSIALMDTALRRRFVFEEMMPQPELLNKSKKIIEYKKEISSKPNQSHVDDLKINKDDIEINMRLMLTKINERIEFLYDRDHTIGHAYFIGLKDFATEKQYPELCSIFKNKIIPLLQEYFYDDWEKIQIVLGDHIKQLGNDKEPEEFTADLNKIRFVQSRVFTEKNILGFNHDDYEDKIKYQINQSLTDSEQNLINPEAFIKIYQPKAQ